MRISEEFPSKYLRSADVGDEELRCTITRVSHSDDSTVDKPQLFIRENPKALQ